MNTTITFADEDNENTMAVALRRIEVAQRTTCKAAAIYGYDHVHTLAAMDEVSRAIMEAILLLPASISGEVGKAASELYRNGLQQGWYDPAGYSEALQANAKAHGITL